MLDARGEGRLVPLGALHHGGHSTARVRQCTRPRTIPSSPSSSSCGLQANTHSLWLCLSCASRASGIRLRRSFPRSSPSTRSSRLARRPWSRRYRALSHWYHSSILTHDTGVRLPEQRAYDESIRNWLTDNTYLRFLKARNWVVDDAFKQLDDTLKWRSEVRDSRGIAPCSHSRSHSHCA